MYAHNKEVHDFQITMIKGVIDFRYIQTLYNWQEFFYLNRLYP